MWKIIYFSAFFFSLVFSCVFTSIFRNIALRLNIVDNPDGKRKTHANPLPLLGGLGMYCSFSLTIIAGLGLILLAKKLGMIMPETALYFKGIYSRVPQVFTILATALFLTILGLADDIKGLSAKTKLIFQVILSLIVFFSGIRITFFIENNFISAILTICWIIGITNAFNLLDNMDGLSCGTALISSFIFFLVASSGGHFFVAAILSVFIGILSGFLIFNFPPALIFMGDAGSLFIGFTLSILIIINTYYTPGNPTSAPVIMPLLIMAIPIFDTLSVIYIRKKNNVSIFTADNNHLSHRLVKLGMSAKNSVLFIYLLNFCIGLGALLLSSLNMYGCIIVLIQAILILAIIVFLEKVKK